MTQQTPAVQGKTGRKNLRDQILGQKGRRLKVVLEGGHTVEIRQLSVGQMIEGSSEVDLKKRMANYLINCCFVPDTDEKIFEDTDFDVLMNLPAGGYYQQLIDAINSQLLPAQMEEAGKD